jgi:1-acyl-sn-glycerol-3-phosphate acyltransferase
MAHVWANSRAALRLLRGLWHIAAGLCLIALCFPRLSQAQRQARVQAWALKLLHSWNIGLQVRGQPQAQGPLLLVCNHLSWLDISVIHAALYCRFVSKSDIRHWPVLGPLATGAGTLYIERSKRQDARRMVHDMAQAMTAGDVVSVFPEGTTGNGKALLPFHANLIQSALLAQAPIQPVGLRFVDTRTGKPTQAPAYAGADTLMASVWRTLQAPSITAVLHFGPLQHAQGRDRREWAKDLQHEVERLRCG